MVVLCSPIVLKHYIHTFCRAMQEQQVERVHKIVLDAQALPAFPASLANLVTRPPVAPPSRFFNVGKPAVVICTQNARLAAASWHRCYAIRAKDLGISLRFTVTQRGFAPDSGASGLTISANARDFLLLLSRREDPDSLFFSRRLVSEGDTALGLTVKNLLDALDPELVLYRLPEPLARAAQRLMGT